jgi:thiosulfate dehydrogenase
MPRLVIPLLLLPLAMALGCAVPGEDVSPPPAGDPGDATPTWQPPPLPDGPLGVSVQRGLAILGATRDSLPEHVGNDLRCTSCHLDNGTRPNAMPWIGVYGQFPQYRSREARVATIEDRINGCLLRSMNGTALPADDDRMRDMVAYMAYLGTGLEMGARVDGQGVPKIDAIRGDTIHGAEVWQASCARCHGADGAGTPLAPPTWGPRSFNIGAGMARIRTAAGFIRHNMPFDQPGTLTDTEALDVAAYLTSRPRPDFAGKEHDWPRGDAPPDAAYPTLGLSGTD